MSTYRKQKSLDEAGVRRRLREILRDDFKDDRQAMAKAVGCFPSRLSSWIPAAGEARSRNRRKRLTERSLPKANALFQICHVTGCSADWLLSGIEPRYRNQSRDPVTLERDVAAYVEREITRRVKPEVWHANHESVTYTWRVDGAAALKAFCDSAEPAARDALSAEWRRGLRVTQALSYEWLLRTYVPDKDQASRFPETKRSARLRQVHAAINGNLHEAAAISDDASKLTLKLVPPADARGVSVLEGNPI